jgi:hypothetical protein
MSQTSGKTLPIHSVLGLRLIDCCVAWPPGESQQGTVLRMIIISSAALPSG